MTPLKLLAASLAGLALVTAVNAGPLLEKLREKNAAGLVESS